MASGTALLDFGSTPTNEASVIVSEPSIAAATFIEPWVMGSDTSSNNDADAHYAAGVFMRPVITALSPGAGFTLSATLIAGLATGIFKIRWASV